jgi:carboxypeptidase C (cathepsin A)
MIANGQTLEYTADAGYLPIINHSTNETEAYMFSVAYTKNGVDPHTRPVMFAFNGGPGSATVWLHMGALGPKMANLTDSGEFPVPPFKAISNPDTWLEFADIVCIDAIGAGLSHTVKPGERKFFGVQPDIEAFGEFIRLWITQNKRWASPLYVCGESYGGIRAGGLCKWLLDNGIALNGMVIVSGVMNYQVLSFSRGNDLAYLTYLPSMTATAWYHKKLSARLQRDLQATLKEVQAWADRDYVLALQKGDSISEGEKKTIAAKLSEYTGISQKFILLSNIRIRDSHFYKELLRDDGATIGRLDARIKGADASGVTSNVEYDASSAAMTAPYMSCLYDYLTDDLKFAFQRKYFTFGAVNPWDFGGGRSYPDTSEPFRACLVQNPSMKVLFTYGYYDFACPFGSMKYTLDHMDLHPDRRSNLEFTIYPAGHMMYIEKGSRKKLADDVRSFVRRSSGASVGPAT